MLRAGVGCSLAPRADQAAIEATTAALKEAGLRTAQAVFCFASCTHGGGYGAILRRVAERAQTSNVVGCGAIGLIGGEREIEGGQALVVMVIGGEELRATRFFAPGLRARPNEIANELTAAIEPQLSGNDLLCLVADTYNFAPESVLEPVARSLPQLAVAGGGATEDGSTGENFVFCGDLFANDALSAMLLGGDIEVTLGASLACQPTGPLREITAARGNVVVELDGAPALEVFRATVGSLAEDLNRAARVVYAGFPLMPRAQRLERGNFMVRNLIGFSEEHQAIAVAHKLTVGDTMGFAVRSDHRARDELKATLQEMVGRVKGQPLCGLYFNCVSRGSGLYGMPDHDIAYIHQQLAGLPVAGFFSGFEIGPTAGATRLLQYSGVLALISRR